MTGGGQAPDPEAFLRAAAGLAGDASPYDLLRAARQPYQKFLPTLVSGWERSGAPVNPALAYELDLHRRRAARYRTLARELAGSCPTLVAVKGFAVDWLYPDGLVRQMNDLDLVCDREEDLWAAASALAGAGWSVTGLWATSWDGRLEFSVVLEHPPADPALLRPDRVDLTTTPLEGDQWSVPPRRFDLLGHDSAVQAVVYLLEEKLLRDFTTRDLFDARLLLGAVAADGRGDALGAAVAEAGLAPEWAALVARLDRLPGGAGPLATAVATPADGAARRWPALATTAPAPWGVAARAAARRVRRRPSRVASRSLVWLQQAAGAERLLRSGVPLYGIEVDAGRAPADRAVLTFDGPSAVVETPVGTFALCAGDTLPEAWLARRAGGGSG